MREGRRKPRAGYLRIDRNGQFPEPYAGAGRGPIRFSPATSPRGDDAPPPGAPEEGPEDDPEDGGSDEDPSAASTGSEALIAALVSSLTEAFLPTRFGAALGRGPLAATKPLLYEQVKHLWYLPRCLS